jgi:hypothetical protein
VGVGGSSGIGPEDDGGSDSSGGSSSGSGSGSGSVGFSDDAAIDVAPPPAGLAGFAFLIDGVVQTPLACPNANWEFAAPQQGNESAPPIVGSALIVNTGAVPLAYTAQTYWTFPGHYVPGEEYEAPPMGSGLYGVLEPGDRVDIASVYFGGVVAILGSAEPFSATAGHYVSDEGTIPWPTGVSGSNGSTVMNVAEISVRDPPSCGPTSQAW